MLNPVGVPVIGRDALPGCAARPWPLEWNAFGVWEPCVPIPLTLTRATWPWALGIARLRRIGPTRSNIMTKTARCDMFNRPEGHPTLNQIPSMHRRLFLAQLVGTLLLTYAQSSQPSAQTQLGVAHIGGLYSFTETDYLNEGADAALEIGAKCIKVSLSLDTDNPSTKYYAKHSAWPTVKSLADLAAITYYRAFFAKPFETFILTAFRPGRSASYWRERFTEEDAQAEESCFADLTRYLLTTYSQSGKTFIIQNWEGDWALRGTFDPATTPTPAAKEAMIRWLQARQRGVERGRAQFTRDQTKVFHACEVNLVRHAIEQKGPTVTNDVLPHIEVDLASYSAWTRRVLLNSLENH